MKIKNTKNKTRDQLAQEVVELQKALDIATNKLSTLDVDTVLESKKVQLQKDAIQLEIDYGNAVQELEDVKVGLSKAVKQITEYYGVTLNTSTLEDLQQSINDAEVLFAEQLQDANKTASDLVHTAQLEKIEALQDLYTKKEELENTLNVLKRELKAVEDVANTKIQAIKKMHLAELSNDKANETSKTARDITALQGRFNSDVSDLERLQELQNKSQYNTAVLELVQPIKYELEGQVESINRANNRAVQAVRATHKNKIDRLDTIIYTEERITRDTNTKIVELRDAITAFRSASVPNAGK